MFVTKKKFKSLLGVLGLKESKDTVYVPTKKTSVWGLFTEKEMACSRIQIVRLFSMIEEMRDTLPLLLKYLNLERVSNCTENLPKLKKIKKTKKDKVKKG